MLNDKVLIIRLSAMGDVVFTIPLANALKENGYEVTWLTGDKGIDLLRGNPAVDNVIYFPEKEQKSNNIFHKIYTYFEIIKYIRSQNFDIAIDTQGLLKTFIWTKFCGARRRIVSKSAREGAIFGGNEVIEKLYTSWDTHVTQDYLKFAEHLGVEVKEPKVTLPVPSEETIEKVNNLLANLDRSKPVITIAPATTWENKHWRKGNWRELISRLKENYSLVFVGTGKDNGLIKYVSDGCGLNLAGKTNIEELCEVFRRTDLLISLDSGSTHLAWATQVPKIVSIFCCTPKSRYAPLGPDDKYIALSGKLDCQPCHKKKCRLKTNACTKLPTTNEVIEAVYKLLPANN